MFVDASAIIAILTREPKAQALVAALDATRPAPLVTSAIAVWEATAGLFRKKRMNMVEAQRHVEAFLVTAGVELLANSPDELPAALRAFDLYGRHRYADADRNRSLNLADCFHYATATSRQVPILSLNAGFALTDASVAEFHAG